jgi:general secretion pathway protein K
MIRDERGFVLIAVLWLLVALSAVGLDAGLRGRSERLAAANAIDETRARAAAQAGAEYARSRLTAAMLDQADELRAEAAARRNRDRGNRALSVRRLFRDADPVDDPWRDPEELLVTQLAVGDAVFDLRVRDTGAALNLNEADEETLRQFFSQGLRLDFALADRITQGILDWRDEDDIPRLGGGEREQYLREGLPVLPSNGPFSSIHEIAYVRGMTAEVLARALPYLSVIGSGRINVNAAPEPVLLAVPGMTPAVATQLLLDRENGILPRRVDDVLDMLAASPGSSRRARERELERAITLVTTEVEILSEGWVQGSPIRSTIHVIVTRAEEGALVVWRSVE